MMRAAVVERYGPPEVARAADIPLPTPRADEVLVRVVSAAVTSGDARVRAARFPRGFTPFARAAFGVARPRRKVLGSAFSGEITAVGARAGQLAPGDAVCGMTGMRMGAHAEYVSVPAKRVVRKPPGVSHDDAAGVLFGGTTALSFLRDKAAVGPDATVLVNGAAGAVGSNAVQLGVHLGATVAGVTSNANAALVADLGAARVIDYTRVDVSSLPDRFDVVFDAVGNLSVASGRRLLNPGGKLVLAVASLGETLRARGDVVAGSAPERAEDFAYLLDLVGAGTLHVVIDSVHSLDDIAAAYRRVDSGHKVGNVLVHPA